MDNKFAHFGMSCKDSLTVERFYTKHFGFKRTRVIPGDDPIVFIQSGNLGIEIFQAKAEAPVPPAGGAGPEYPGWRHLRSLCNHHCRRNLRQCLGLYPGHS